MDGNFISFDQFSTITEDLVRQIPDKFKKGIAGIFVTPGAVVDDEFSDVYVLGHYTSGGYCEPSIDIYYGSFRKIFSGLSLLQLQNEIWETIIHEIRHHLEENAGLQDLRIFDQQQKEYFQLSKNASPEVIELLPTYSALNLKCIGDRLLGDLVLEASEAPQKIKVDVSLPESNKQILLIDFPSGIFAGQMVKLNLLNRFAQTNMKSSYFEIRPNRKYPTIASHSGDLWYLFDPPNLRKSALFKQSKWSRENCSCEARPVNFKRIDGCAYFDVFLNYDAIKKSLMVRIPDFTAGRKSLIVRLKTEDINNFQSGFTKRVSNITVQNFEIPQDVYLTFHPFK